MGENGAKWGHGWKPENAVAAAIKAHQRNGGKPLTARQLGTVISGKQLPKPKPKPKAARPRAPRKPAKPKAPDAMADLLKTARPARPAAAKPPAKTTEQRVRDAVTAAGGSSAGFVKVTDVKNHMAGMTEAQKDHALTTAFAAGKVNLIPQSNQQALTAEQRKRAVNVGGETKHLISFT